MVNKYTDLNICTQDFEKVFLSHDISLWTPECIMYGLWAKVATSNSLSHEGGLGLVRQIPIKPQRQDEQKKEKQLKM